MFRPDVKDSWQTSVSPGYVEFTRRSEDAGTQPRTKDGAVDQVKEEEGTDFRWPGVERQDDVHPEAGRAHEQQEAVPDPIPNAVSQPSVGWSGTRYCPSNGLS